jgi:hypothetical protein
MRTAVELPVKVSAPYFGLPVFVNEIPVRRNDFPVAVAAENVELIVMLVLSTVVQVPPGAHVPVVVLCP